MNQQTLVNGYFESTATFWREIYEHTDLVSRIYQLRFRSVLEQVDRLHLPPGSRVLEAGCGAGHTTVALAARGFNVEALDSAQAMADQTRARVAEARHASHVRTGVGDIYRLAYSDGEFALALAIGVLPWLEDRHRAINELARTVAPGGHILVTMDNSNSVSRWLDPSLNPLLLPAKRSLARWLSRTGLRKTAAHATFCSNREIDLTLARNGLRKLWSTTVGFGPITFLNRSVLPARAGEKLHERLQTMAFQPSSCLRGAGSHYLVLAQKPMSQVWKGSPSWPKKEEFTAQII